MTNTPIAGVFAEILTKKDHRYKYWISQAEFQLKQRSCNDLARYTSGEDIIMEVIGGVLTGKITWDTKRVPNICTFMFHQIRSHVANISKKERRRLQSESTIYEGQPNLELRTKPQWIKGESFEEFNTRQDLLEVRKLILKDLEKDTIAYFVYEEIMSGAKNREAAKTLQISVIEVQNAKRRIRTMIRNISSRLVP